MVVGTSKMKLHCGWVHSLKEKRMVIRSIIGKVQSKFHISIAEVEAMDLHQTIILGMAVVCNEEKKANQILDEIIRYIEEITEAELLDVESEIIS